MNLELGRVSTRLRRWLGGTVRNDAGLLDASVWRQAPVGLGVASDTSSPTGSGLDPELAPVLGEYAWHSLTLDPRLAEVSEEHFSVVAKILADAGFDATKNARMLEVASYAHTTGYLLHQRLGAHTDLLDISPSTLRLGRRLARDQGLPTDATRCVAGDFHELPYADAQFDVVYICSALHHTWRWQRVLKEMMRVLAPGGILLLENEPCRRRFCHYRFRANRQDEYGPLERELDRLGILRTVAEPFPGTRPESLFGMVENQTMPIAELCGALAAECQPVAMTVNSDVCMGDLESGMVTRRREGKGACTRWLVAEMLLRVDAARAAMSTADRGMGFGLPSRGEIEKLCASAVEALVALPSDSSSPDFRIGLADVFGASLRVAVRKGGVRQVVAAGRLAHEFPISKEVVHAFPPRISRLLDPDSALLPDIQSGSIEAVNENFPPADWALSVSADGLRSLAPKHPQPAFGVSVPSPGSLLILVRLFVVVESEPFRVMLCAGGEEIARFDAYRTDSVLLTPIVRGPQQTRRLELSIRTQALDASTDSRERVFNISYVGAFAL
ncbi:MAG TPA: class I SAM-dependent methyltransferase [Casimicrobiaceae bacterium]